MTIGKIPTLGSEQMPPQKTVNITPNNFPTIKQPATTVHKPLQKMEEDAPAANILQQLDQFDAQNDLLNSGSDDDHAGLVKRPLITNSKAYYASNTNHGKTFYNYLKESVEKEKRDKVKLESKNESLIIVIKQLVLDL